jgi:UDP-N-acetylglucosamine--N-acetylmuramyl-(pentapeptide) pyrophosphoryl-undecaprenol N-acetylglucosamine transferase
LTALLVASTGGHLKELHHLRWRLSDVDGPYRWVTFDTPQSRSLLAGEEVEFVRFVGDRDAVNAVRSLGEARRLAQDPEVDAVISTGASVAIPYIAMARARRLRCCYVESAARIDGPSLSGRLLSGVPGVTLVTQCRGWAGGRWRYGGSVFDSFEPVDPAPTGAARLEKVVVALGTTAEGFPRIVRRLKAILPPEADVLWQTGNTDISELGVPGHHMLPERDLTEAMREADAVVCHAGVGNALAALEVGKCPVIVPRRLSFEELVDDHQVQIARELRERGLAISVEADEVTREDLLAASRRGVAASARTASFAIAAPSG